MLHIVDNSCYNTLSSAFSNCERKLVRRRGAGRDGRLGPRPRGRIQNWRGGPKFDGSGGRGSHLAQRA